MMSARFLALCAACLATACIPYQPLEKPDVAAQFGETRLETDKFFREAEPVAEWWRELGDDQLTGLVERALEENKDVRSALANLKAVRLSTDRTRLNLKPSGSGNANISRDVPERGGAGEVNPRTGR